MNKPLYAFSTGALYPLRSRDAVALVKEAGFDGAELMPQSLYDTSARSLMEMERVGLPLTSIHYPLAFFPLLYTSQPDMLLDGRKYSKQLLNFAADLGAGVLVVHPHTSAKPEHRDLLEQPVIDNLLWLADRCKDKGILLAMENHPKTCATSAQLRQYINFLNHPNILPMADTTEVREAGGDPAAFIRDLPPCHLHLSDFVQDRKHLPPGEGEIDWPGVRDALGDYQGVYTVEPSYRYYLEDIPAKLKRDLRFIRQLIEGTRAT